MTILKQKRNYHSLISKGNNSINVKKRLMVLVASRRLMLLYISMKCHENILNSFQVIERT